MGSLNKVMLIGNMGKDPDVRTIPSGVKVASFSIATSENYTNRDGQKVDKTEWHNIVLWRGLAEIAEKYLRKGSQVYIEGRLQTRSWDDQNGNKRYTTEIIGDSMVMLGKPGGGNREGGFNPDSESESFNQSAPRDRGNDRGGDRGKPAYQPSNMPPPAEDDLPF